MAGDWPEREVAELTGSDEFVVVTAWVTHIEDVAAHMPHQKGILGDDSSWNQEPRKFTVWDDDLELEKGNLYRIFGKDKAYDPFEEIQMQIGDADHVDLVCEGE